MILSLNTTLGSVFALVIAGVWVIKALRLRRQVAEYQDVTRAVGVIVLPDGTRAVGTLDQQREGEIDRSVSRALPSEIDRV